MKDSSKDKTIVQGSGNQSKHLAKGGQPLDPSRRRFTKAGVAAPVIATLVSRPVWGADCSISGLQSGNISDHDNSECSGRGCTPGFWKNNPAAWIIATRYIPGDCVTWQGKLISNSCKEWNTGSGTRFYDVFGRPSVMDVVTNGSVEHPKSMLAVMLDHEEAGNIGTYENHLVAAVLNADAAPGIYGATVQEILDTLAMVDSGQIAQQDFFDTLVAMNEAGDCFLNAQGFCADGSVSNEVGDCIPSCEGGQRWDFCDETCVPQGEETSLEELLKLGYNAQQQQWNACMPSTEKLISKETLIPDEKMITREKLIK